MTTDLQKLRDEALEIYMGKHADKITAPTLIAREAFTRGFDACLTALAAQSGEFDEAWRMNIVEKAQQAFRRSRGGARGQMVTEADSSDYWLITAVTSELVPVIAALRAKLKYLQDQYDGLSEVKINWAKWDVDSYDEKNAELTEKDARIAELEAEVKKWKDCF